MIQKDLKSHGFMKRQVIIAGNWKMHKTIQEATQFIEELLPQLAAPHCGVWIAPPSTAISTCADKAKESPLKIGAQNVSYAGEGAFTGEISGKMAKEAGAFFCLIGHSERRTLFGETDDTIALKVRQTISQDLVPVLCIGETLAERDEGRTEAVLKGQLIEGLKGFSADELKELVIAYEPVWAIGTGKTASAEMAQAAHAFIRKEVAIDLSKPFAESLSILYGGSVKPANIEELIKQPDIDGALVGGASLEVDSFAKLVKLSAS